MRKKSLDHRTANVSATFYEPTYQRMSVTRNGERVELLCFVRETSNAVKLLLGRALAEPTKEFKSECFAEIWELSYQNLVIGKYSSAPTSLDQELVTALGCHEGKRSAAVGYIKWDDVGMTDRPRNHAESEILKDAHVRKSRNR